MITGLEESFQSEGNAQVQWQVIGLLVQLNWSVIFDAVEWLPVACVFSTDLGLLR